MVEIVETKLALRARADAARAAGQRVGLVPTMGFLHEGHRSLMQAARRACDVVIVTIFVNPMQFGPNEDLDRYPRDLDGDLDACRAEGVDIVFAPSIREMYPREPSTTVVHVAELTTGLCGESRPGHFDGVTTIVTKLFAITGPCHAYFGRKDAQQLAVITRMVDELDLPVTVVGCPLVREPDGLALSSRNAYLSAEHRTIAPQIHAALCLAADAVAAGETDPRRAVDIVRAHLRQWPDFSIDYVACVDSATLQAVDQIDADTLLAVAVRLGSTRLIDNVLLGASS